MSETASLRYTEDFPRKRWTVRECQTLTEIGLLTPDKYQLIEGDIVFKMPQSRFHIYVVTQLIALLSVIFGAQYVQSQANIGIGSRDEQSDPEPDVAVLTGTVRDYLDRQPDPTRDIRLVVEVSDTTLKGDTTIKAHIYARNGVPDYWVVDLRGRRLLVHRDPTPSGYNEILTFAEDELIAPLAASDSSFLVRDLLP